jgi:DICT domain-containing protein
LFDAESIMHDLGAVPEEGKSIKRLEDIKLRLASIKHDAEEQVQARLAAIDGVIKAIDEKIARCEAEKTSWRRIPIEDGTFGNK